MNNKKEKISDKIKEGVSVQEIENFAKKYTSEVFSALSILVATISSLFNFFTGSAWSVVFAGIGAIIGLIFPNQTNMALGKLYGMLRTHEKSTQIIFGIVKLVIAIFVPFVLFAILGLLGGTSTHLHTYLAAKPKPKQTEEK